MKKGLRLFWFATGKDDFLLDTTKATVKLLESHGFKVTFQETDGGHTWINWREHYLPEFAQLLFRDDATAGRPTASPRRPSSAGPRLPVTLSPAPAGFDRRRSEVAAGKVETIEYDSKTVGIKRKMVIYTPPGYSQDQRYPVLYLLHGIGDTQAGWTRERRK